MNNNNNTIKEIATVIIALAVATFQFAFRVIVILAALKYLKS